MATCNHETTYLQVPPSLKFLVQNYPHIVPHQTLDRSTPRCKLCDLISAHERATIAENPPPYINAVEQIERDIELIDKLVTADVATKQDKEDLTVLHDQLRDAIMLADIRIQEAWYPYWAIWGPGDGPEVLDTVFDDGEDLIDWGV